MMTVSFGSALVSPRMSRKKVCWVCPAVKLKV